MADSDLRPNRYDVAAELFVSGITALHEINAELSARVRSIRECVTIRHCVTKMASVR